MAKKLQQTLSRGLNLICFLFCLSWLPIKSSSQNELTPVTVSNLHFPETILRPYGWRYIRVDLPPGFASMSMNLQSDVDIDPRTIKDIPKSKLPIICFRNGSPPLPDVSSISLAVLSPTNDSAGDSQTRQLVEKCHPLQENIKLLLTNEQISSGVWYIGLFNGFGPVVTQSMMIIRGSAILYSVNISVEGCPTSATWGQFCNQTVAPFSCAGMYNQTEENVTTCRNFLESSCGGYKPPRGYSVDVAGPMELLKVMAVNSSLNDGPINNTRGLKAALYARYGAMPSGSLHDYASDISENPLVIQSPKVGRWYISLLAGNETEAWVPMGNNDIISDPCYSLEWQLQQCSIGKGGPNCTWQSYMLQTVISKSPSVPFESYYLPEKTSLDSSKFLLEPLLSNSTVGDNSEYAWTYFLLEIPPGAAGGHVHVQLKSDSVLNYEIYSRSGGLPSLDTWDYYYTNKTSSSSGSVYFNLYESSPRAVSFYILYAKEGTWCFGLRHRVHTGVLHESSTLMSIASERCPKGCSSPHGTCQNVLDASGLTLYSYCFCDRDHGGFDCSIEIVSHQGQIWQSIALIASNGAAILPAFWTLRQKAFAEWVLFTSSGISSALYHACDVGTWCVLSFRVLQFLDFWLSFMAVVSTFVYLTTIDEVSKRVIHTIVAILTAILAVSGATRSSNIIIVVAIGALGLIIGWLIESSTTIRSFSLTTMLSLNIYERWQHMKDRVYNFFKTLRSRFRWWYILAGFILLSLAGLSWKLETNQSYWIWHSLWHVTIYTCSFFFLYSKVAAVDRSTEEGHNVTYELTRQDSLSRV